MMRNYIFIFLILVCLIGFPGFAQGFAKEFGQNTMESPLDGHIVFAPLASRTTYMIDEESQVLQTWDSNYLPGLSVYWNPDNSIYRAMLIPGGGDIGGQGGGIQKIASDGTILWEYTYTSSTYWAHHDFVPLSNGNVLMLARETKTFQEATEEGRNPDVIQLIQGDPQTDFIIEVQPTGPTTGDIVWEWHAWDHLIQDFDSSKNNFGVVRDHPELIDINYHNEVSADWLHTNSLDYNEQLDQILISVRTFNEIWVIDHSTTTEQASGHTGGLSGKGGDLLYRWGNPEAYDRGSSSDRELFWQHDAVWVPDTYPGEGNILIFNNGVGRGYSSVDEITPPIDSQGAYTLTQEGYGPFSLTWSYVAQPPEDFYALHLSGQCRLQNGNTLILQGERGHFFIVDTNQEILWSYDYPSASLLGQIFKPYYVPNTTPMGPIIQTVGSLRWSDVKPGGTVHGSFIIRNIGFGRMNWSIDTSLVTWGNWTITPSSGFCYHNDSILITVDVVVPEEENSDFEGYLKVQNLNNPMDFELVPVILTTELSLAQYNQKQSIVVQMIEMHKNSYRPVIM